MDSYYIYLKQDTFACGSYIFVHGFFLQVQISISICVCIEMYLWEESNLYLNHICESFSVH